MTSGAVQFVLVDPVGRRTGFDPASGNTLNEIPESDYQLEFFTDEEDPSAPSTPYTYSLSLGQPTSGTYGLTLFGDADADFIEHVNAYDGNGGYSDQEIQGHVSPTSVVKQTVVYSSSPGSQVVVNGAPTATPTKTIVPTATPTPTPMATASRTLTPAATKDAFYSDSHSEAHANAHSDSNPDAHRHPDSDPYPHPDANVYAHSDTHPDIDSYSHEHTDPYAHSDADSYADAHANSDGDTYAH